MRHATLSQETSLAHWLLALLASVAVIFLLALPQLGRLHTDSAAYIDMARLAFDRVDPPFVQRPLVPLAAWALARLGLPLDAAFLAVTLASALVFVGALLHCWRRWGLPLLPLALCLLPVPALVQQVETIHLTDLAYWAASALMLALLLGARNHAAALSFLLIFAARPSAPLILAATVAILLWHRRDWSALGLLVLCVVAGEAIAAFSASFGLPDKYGIAGPIYLLLKLANNFAMSYLGLGTWTNVYSWCPDVAWRFELPGWLQVGRLREVGFCRPSAALASEVYLRLATLFGLLPGVAAALAGDRLGRLWREQPAMLLLLGYGVLLTLLGPMTGNATVRLVFQGWPAFLLAVPFLFAWRGPELGSLRSLWWLGAGHLALSWLPQAQHLFTGADREADYWFDPRLQAARFALALLAILANVLVWRQLRARSAHRAVDGRERNVT